MTFASALCAGANVNLKEKRLAIYGKGYNYSLTFRKMKKREFPKDWENTSIIFGRALSGLLEEGERLVLQIIFGPRVNLIKKVFDKIKKTISY